MASFCADDDDDDAADDADGDDAWGVTGSPHAADGDSSGSEDGGMLGTVGGLGDADGSDGMGAVSCEFRDASQGGGCCGRHEWRSWCSLLSCWGLCG